MVTGLHDVPTLCPVLRREMHLAEPLLREKFAKSFRKKCQSQGGKEVPLLYVDTMLGTDFTFILRDEISRQQKTVLPITITSIGPFP